MGDNPNELRLKMKFYTAREFFEAMAGVNSEIITFDEQNAELPDYCLSLHITRIELLDDVSGELPVKRYFRWEGVIERSPGQQDWLSLFEQRISGTLDVGTPEEHNWPPAKSIMALEYGECHGEIILTRKQTA